MTHNELLTDVYARNAHTIKLTLADFSNAEMFVRPVPHANHAAWQLGHLITAECRMLGSCGAAMPQLPAGWAERFTKETAALDDPAKFASKAELLAMFDQVRNASIAFVKSVQPADLEKPGPERMREFAPTVAHVVEMVPGHALMHIGQLQVIRRKLGKPLLF